MSEKSNNKKSGFSKFIAGKGFYIVLLLCICVIGAAAWAILFSSPTSEIDVPEEPDVVLTLQPSVSIPIYSEPSSSPDLPASVEDGTDTAPEPAIVTQQVEEPVVSSDPGGSVPVINISTPPDLYVWPVSGTIELPYSMTSLVFNRTMADWRTHSGIDIAATLGAKVMAIADGTVERVYEDEMYGTTVIISHGGGVESVYSNLAATPAVSEGTDVSMGDVVGAIGNTSLAESADITHLHFEIRLDGTPVDPLEYLPDK